MSFSRKFFATDSGIAAGGSAINVARGLRGLGKPCTVYTLLGGDVGHLVRNLLSKEGLLFRSCETKDDTRVAAIAVGTRSRRMLVTPSPGIAPEEVERLLRECYSEIASHDVILIGGSVTEGCSDPMICGLLGPLVAAGKTVIVDSRGSFAQAAYQALPFAVRYNHDGALHDNQNIRRTSTVRVARDLHEAGISFVVSATLGYYHAYFDGRSHRYPRLPQPVPGAHGRGDAFLAAVISVLLDRGSLDEAARFGTACAASFTKEFPLGEINQAVAAQHMYRDKNHGTR